jgi:hypothetical protein
LDDDSVFKGADRNEPENTPIWRIARLFFRTASNPVHLTAVPPPHLIIASVTDAALMLRRREQQVEKAVQD